MSLFGNIAAGITGALNPVGLIGTAGALGSTLAGYFGQQQTNSQNQAIANQNNNVSLEEAQMNDQMQMDFAQNGISWRVADAAKNGISPLAALGASEPSFSPVMPVMQSPQYTSPLSAASAGIDSMGQNLSRALTATQSPEQKASDAIDLAYKSKQNDLLDIQIAQAKLNLAKAGSTPGLPLGYQRVMNADGTTTTAPTYNTHSSLFGPTLWSLDNQLIPSIQENLHSMDTQRNNNAVDVNGSTYYMKDE